MKRNAVLVDVAIDQGGCFETSRPTTHRDPTFEVDGITHYCVANMPGAVPITSTYALTNATLPYAIALADHGVAEAIARGPGAARWESTWRRARSPIPRSPRRSASEYVPVEDALGRNAGDPEGLETRTRQGHKEETRWQRQRRRRPKVMELKNMIGGEVRRSRRAARWRTSSTRRRAR